MKYYAELTLDRPDPIPPHPDSIMLNFEVDADSAPEAMRLLGAYCKGRFEGCGIGAEINRLGKMKIRGVEYRRL